MDVLSQQYSLKCLESAHLAQALEAERRALQQCQRENREIRARHQELSSGVGVEILHRSAPPNTQQKSLCGLEPLDVTVTTSFRVSPPTGDRPLSARRSDPRCSA